VLGGKRGEQCRPEGTHLLPAVIVANGVLQDALKQHGEFIHRLVAIFFGEFEHGILHDVQRCMFVANRKQRLFVGASLDFGKELRKFVVAAQLESSL
jgi:hypothetical protein